MERIRRATLDDLEALRKLWAPLGFNLADLEKRLTEFQVAETAEGKFLGAVGFITIQGQGLIHHEALVETADAAALRPLFWKRLQVLTANHGVMRMWVRDNSQGWAAFGFQPPTMEALERLPEFWDRSASGWQTLPLKDENAMARVDKELAIFMASEKMQSDKIVKGVKVFRGIFIFLCIIVSIGLLFAAVWLFLAHRTGNLMPSQQ